MRSKALNPFFEKLSEDPRLQDHWIKSPWAFIQSAPAPKKSQKAVAVLCHPDDEGVRLNNGRPGAARGPERILYYLGRMIYQFKKTPPIRIISDEFHSGDLSTRHANAKELAKSLLSMGYRLITLGGGHDYGFPDASAYYEVHGGKILNIDSHLDVRPVVNGKLNSGTPFFRFIEAYGGRPLVQWGIQEQCNALSHFDFAKASGAKIYGPGEKLKKISGSVGLSICLDAFSGIRGVSAPCFAGLNPTEGVKTVNTYKQNSSWLGLYESAPELDPLTEDSARFGALLAYYFIHAL